VQSYCIECIQRILCDLEARSAHRAAGREGWANHRCLAGAVSTPRLLQLIALSGNCYWPQSTNATAAWGGESKNGDDKL
jgi:hypothetical protein